MYLYQTTSLVVSETKRPEKKHFETTSGKIKIHDWSDALSEWQNNLIPVKEGEETEKFLQESKYCYLSYSNDLSPKWETDLKNGIYIDDAVVGFERKILFCKGEQISGSCINHRKDNQCNKDCEIKKFAYLITQPKKEESNEAIEFADDIWIELLEEIKTHKKATDVFNRGLYAEVICDLKQKFKLTRK